MADQLDTSGVAIGAISTVCTILLGAAGLNLKQLSEHNSKLVQRIEKRDCDVEKLNSKLLEQGEELGGFRKQEAEQLASIANLRRLLTETEGRNLELILERERWSLERLAMRAEIESLKNNVEKLPKIKSERDDGE